MMFEGMKAYRKPDGSIQLFRPDRNIARMRNTCECMCMPEVPGDLFLEGLTKLIEVDKDWIPSGKNTALYIRPFLFGDEVITAPLDSGTILPGITHNSVIQLLKKWGVKVSERKLSIDEAVAASKDGSLKEIFASGTAAVISPIGWLGVLQNAATLPFAVKCPYSVDVGAVTDRPRAIDSRPYECYRKYCVFCNAPLECAHNRICGGRAEGAGER